MKLREINKTEFENFCKTSSTNNFFQSKAYGEFKRKEGYHTYFLGVDNNGKIKAAMMLLSYEIPSLKKRVFYCPRGYIVNFKDLELMRFLTKSMIEFLKEKKAIYLKINPYLMYKDRDFKGDIIEGGIDNSKCISILEEFGYRKSEFSNPKEPQFIYKLDLINKSLEDLNSSFDSSIEQTCTRNEKIGVTIKSLEKEKYNKFINILRNNTNKLDYLNIKYENYEDLFTILSNNNMLDVKIAELDIDKYLNITLKSLENSKGNEELVRVLNNQLININKLEYRYGHKALIGAILSIKHDKEYTEMIAVINDQFKNFDVLTSIHMENIKEAVENNFESYTFYAIGNSIENNSILNYYKKYNGKVVELIGEYDLVIDEKLYKKLLKKETK